MKRIHATYCETAKTYYLTDSYMARQRVFIGNTDNHNRATSFKNEKHARAVFSKHGYTELVYAWN